MHNDEGHCDRATALALAIRAARPVPMPERIYLTPRMIAALAGNRRRDNWGY